MLPVWEIGMEAGLLGAAALLVRKVLALVRDGHEVAGAEGRG